MPVRYVIDQERRLVTTIGYEHVTLADVKAHEEQLASDPAFNAEFNQLIDATAVTSWDVSVEDTKLIARQTFFSPTSRRAFVATNPAIFGMGRLMAAHHEMATRNEEQVCVFYELEQALRWLGLNALPR